MSRLINFRRQFMSAHAKIKQLIRKPNRTSNKRARKPCTFTWLVKLKSAIIIIRSIVHRKIDCNQMNEVNA